MVTQLAATIIIIALSIALLVSIVITLSYRHLVMSVLQYYKEQGQTINKERLQYIIKTNNFFKKKN